MNSNLMIATFKINLLEKMVARVIISSISSRLGIGNLYLTMILLVAQLLTHILLVPSFLGVNSAVTAQGLKLSRMNSGEDHLFASLIQHVS